MMQFENFPCGSMQFFTWRCILPNLLTSSVKVGILFYILRFMVTGIWTCIPVFYSGPGAGRLPCHQVPMPVNPSIDEETTGTRQGTSAGTW